MIKEENLVQLNQEVSQNAKIGGVMLIAHAIAAVVLFLLFYVEMDEVNLTLVYVTVVKQRYT